MKRIMNDVALATILYVVSGYRKVRITDLENIFDDKTSTVIYEGMLMDWRYMDRPYSVEHAKVRGIYADGDVLCIELCMKLD